MCYSIDSGALKYTQYIADAAYNWMYTGYGGNLIYMTHVSSTYATAIDFKIYSNPNASTLAYTELFNANSDQVIPPSNYYSTEIYINDAIIGNANIGGTMRHEIGHVLGMNENNGNPYSIMAQTWTRKVQTIQKVDHDTVIYLY